MNRRRTDRLPTTASLPTDAIGRARSACEALDSIGIQASCGLLIGDPMTPALLCAGSGRLDQVGDIARGLAEEVARTGAALCITDAHDPMLRLTWRFAALACGSTDQGQIVLVIADPQLTRREGEAIAAWLAAETIQPALPVSGPCAALARKLAFDFDADVVVFALFAQSGMLLNMHVRSGALLRTWRIPVDTVWGEAARHGSAMVVGDLSMHSGAESLASMGMQTAAIVGLENGSGLAIGAVGVAAVDQLDLGIAHQLLARSGAIGAEIMDVRGRTRVPTPDEEGNVDVGAFAARVGCTRFAYYNRSGVRPKLVSAHASDGSMLIAPPDPHEDQLVGWALQKGVAVASDDAAVILIGDDTVLYARDGRKKPMECLRLALQDLRANPHERAA